MAMEHPFVSVVIPTHQRKAILEQALHALKEQTYPRHRYEVLIVSDTLDGTNEMVTEQMRHWKQLRLIVIPSTSVCVARNIGIRQAHGEIVAFTDDDCLPRRNWIEKISARFVQQPTILGIEGKTVKNNRHVFSHATENLRGGRYPACNIAFTKEILNRIGGFDEDYHFFREDTDLAFRVLQHGTIAFDSEVEVFHPPRKIPVVAILRELFLIKGDVRLYKKFPALSRKTFGHVGGGLKQAAAAWMAIALFWSLLMVYPLLSLMALAALPVFKYAIGLKGKVYTPSEALAFIALSTLRDLLFPVFFLYYLLAVKIRRRDAYPTKPHQQ